MEVENVASDSPHLSPFQLDVKLKENRKAYFLGSNVTSQLMKKESYGKLHDPDEFTFDFILRNLGLI